MRRRKGALVRHFKDAEPASEAIGRVTNVAKRERASAIARLRGVVLIYCSLRCSAAGDEVGVRVAAVWPCVLSSVVACCANIMDVRTVGCVACDAVSRADVPFGRAIGGYGLCVRVLHVRLDVCRAFSPVLVCWGHQTENLVCSSGA